ncbi:MAG: Ppx/GppA family phosphatase, partial [Myxococcota bacterium]
MKAAAIDVGSNTVKMTVAERSPDGQTSVVKERADFTRIGEGLDQTGRLQPEAIERTLAAVTSYVKTARELGADRIAAVGTAGLRGAQNADVFLQRARNEAGVDIEVIAGHREASLAYRAPAAEYGPGSMVVVDIGGRST